MVIASDIYTYIRVYKMTIQLALFNVNDDQERDNLYREKTVFDRWQRSQVLPLIKRSKGNDASDIL